MSCPDKTEDIFLDHVAAVETEPKPHHNPLRVFGLYRFI